jgi:hypothetical protein
MADVWEQSFAELEAYKVLHGNCRVPYGYKRNPQLANWVSTQRALKAAGKLAQERVQRLDVLGFEWRVLDAVWEQRFAELEAYKALHGDCKVSTSYKPNPQLGRWVSQQRMQKASGKLWQARMQRLEALGFAWRA